MAVTRNTPRVRVSSPRNQLARSTVKSATSHSSATHKQKRKGGLTKELAALGIIPKPEKKAYDGPGERGDSARLTAQGTECSICAETQAQREFPEAATLNPCEHESRICRTCVARHTETQLFRDGKWRHVQCLECHAKQTKAQICKLVWKEDFKLLEAFAKLKADQANPRYRACLSSGCHGGQVHKSHKTSVVTCKDTHATDINEVTQTPNRPEPPKKL
ncbi:MAG: hypothetical protein Q9171_002983 [Xanthocarpia ochracea]